MKKNKISKNNKKEIEQKTRVLLEDMQSDIKRVAEGHSTIIRKLEEHDAGFIEIDRRFDRVEMVVSDTNRRVKSIEVKSDSHEKRLTKLESIPH